VSDLLAWGAMPILAVATAWVLVEPLRRAGGERRALTLIMIAIPVFGLLLYLNLGAQGRPDMPLADRLDAPVLELPIGAIIVKIERRLAETPNDAEGWRILARLRQQIGDYDRAIEAWDIVAQLEGKSADISVAIAESYMALDGGMVNDAATRALAEALTLDPNHPRARFLQGLSLMQQGKRAQALALWDQLIASLDPSDPFRQTISALIQQVQSLVKNQKEQK